VPDDPTVLRSTVEKLVQDRYNIIIGAGAGYSSAFQALARAHPDVAFLNAAGAANGPNLESFYPRTYESQYLCGMAAGAVSKSGKLGYLATRPIGLVRWAVNAYELGARAMNPNAEVTIVYIGTAAADATVRAATLSLIKRGADVIGELVGSPTPQIVAQENGVMATGYHRDLREFAPIATQCSSVSVWDRFLEPEIAKIAAGTWRPNSNGAFLSIKEGTMDIACCGSAVPQDAVDKIMAARQELIDGKREVYAGPLNDREGKQRVPSGQVLGDADLWAMDWYVQGVAEDLDLAGASAMRGTLSPPVIASFEPRSP
jgi:basic membrane protein A and related proteins